MGISVESYSWYNLDIPINPNGHVRSIYIDLNEQEGRVEVAYGQSVRWTTGNVKLINCQKTCRDQTPVISLEYNNQIFFTFDPATGQQVNYEEVYQTPKKSRLLEHLRVFVW